MTAVLHQAALLVTLFGLLSVVCIGLWLRRAQPMVALLTDFLLAAGLIRLAAEPSWMSLATSAATAAVRMLLNAGLRAPAARHHERAWNRGESAAYEIDLATCLP